jgi:hypothetical protein
MKKLFRVIIPVVLLLKQVTIDPLYTPTITQATIEITIQNLYIRYDSWKNNEKVN